MKHGLIDWTTSPAAASTLRSGMWRVFLRISAWTRPSLDWRCALLMLRARAASAGGKTVAGQIEPFAIQIAEAGDERFVILAAEPRKLWR